VYSGVTYGGYSEMSNVDLVFQRVKERRKRAARGLPKGGSWVGDAAVLRSMRRVVLRDVESDFGESVGRLKGKGKGKEMVMVRGRVKDVRFDLDQEQRIMLRLD